MVEEIQNTESKNSWRSLAISLILLIIIIFVVGVGYFTFYIKGETQETSTIDETFQVAPSRLIEHYSYVPNEDDITYENIFGYSITYPSSFTAFANVSHEDADIELAKEDSRRVVLTDKECCNEEDLVIEILEGSIDPKTFWKNRYSEKNYKVLYQGDGLLNFNTDVKELLLQSKTSNDTVRMIFIWDTPAFTDEIIITQNTVGEPWDEIVYNIKTDIGYKFEGDDTSHEGLSKRRNDIIKYSCPEKLNSENTLFSSGLFESFSLGFGFKYPIEWGLINECISPPITGPVYYNRYSYNRSMIFDKIEFRYDQPYSFHFSENNKTTSYWTYEGPSWFEKYYGQPLVDICADGQAEHISFLDTTSYDIEVLYCENIVSGSELEYVEYEVLATTKFQYGTLPKYLSVAHAQELDSKVKEFGVIFPTKSEYWTGMTISYSYWPMNEMRKKGGGLFYNLDNTKLITIQERAELEDQKYLDNKNQIKEIAQTLYYTR